MLLGQLADRRARTAVELARALRAERAAVEAALGSLVGAGRVDALSGGGRRHFLLADIDAPASAAGEPAPIPTWTHDRRVLEARTCYRHLAGRLGVALTDRLRARGFIDARWRATREGAQLLGAWGVADAGHREGRGCLDSTERRLHLGGALGAAVCDALFARGWLVRMDAPRAVGLTDAGRTAFAEAGVDVSALSAIEDGAHGPTGAAMER
ncbi:MAG TPA: hypothetical protein PKE32_10165 [Miltoncostaeaceae bacterium]|nr:hypothetical protein [Miltoncostaeaceae bacterium]